MKQQLDSFSKNNEKREEIVQVNFNRKSRAPINEVNLNKLGNASRHYFISSKFKEFLVYGVTFEKSLKRVLTLRTQYLLQNATLLDYDVRITSSFNKDQFEVRQLRAGGLMPLPESYNQSVLQLRLLAKGNRADSGWSDDWHVYALKRVVVP